MTTPAQSKATDKAARGYFLPYQWAWITDEAQLKLYPKSRRVGITYATSYRCVRKCANAKAGSAFTQWVSSKDQGLAQEFISQYVAKWCKLLNIAASGLDGREVEIVDPDKDITAFVVRFPNGARIMSLSSNPRAFAGKGGDVLLDELDLHEHGGLALDMALPCIDWGGQLEVVSAYDPEGSTETAFALLVSEVESGANKASWSLHKTDIDDAIAQGLVEKINEARAARTPPQAPLTREQFRQQQRAKCRTESAWLSQYKCVAVNAAGMRAVSAADLAAAKVTGYPFLRVHLEGDARQGDRIDPSVQTYRDGGSLAALAARLRGRRVSLGYDVARKGHLSAVAVLADLAADLWRLEAMITLHNCKFTSQEELIAALFAVIPGLTGEGDATGLGMSTCENLQDRFPTLFVGMNFSASKQEIGAVMCEWYQKGCVQIPADPPEIAGDVAAVLIDTTIKGRQTYAETANRFNELSHADMAWALALAIHNATAAVPIASQRVTDLISRESAAMLGQLPPHLQRRQQELVEAGGCVV